MNPYDRTPAPLLRFRLTLPKTFPRSLPPNMVAPAAFLGAAILAFLAAFWAAVVVEERSAAAVQSELLNAGLTWATVTPDGLQVQLTGTAPNEAARFRAVNLAGSVVDAARVRDRLEVTPVRAIEPPRFSVEMLRNGDGIQLIGLLPAPELTAGTTDAPAPTDASATPTSGSALAAAAAAMADGVKVTDMLESAAFPAPEGWDRALDFGLAALKLLPRSKISVSADRVSIFAISDSPMQKRSFEVDLAALKPEGLDVAIDISAPRPVLTPFTLRFVKDVDGARFDACSADTDRSRDRIVAAARAAGATGRLSCTVGMGVPSPSWAQAAEVAIRAIAELGAGSITFSDADVTLLAGIDTTQASFDTVVGELQTSLPPAFSLQATLPPKENAAPSGPAEFTAKLSSEGAVQLRGRLTDDLMRSAVDSFARAEFGADQVYTATRLDSDLPDGWSIRVLAGLAAMGELADGALLVRADTVEISGNTGSQTARDRISQILSDQLGQGQTFKISVKYVEALDPTAALPTPEECMANIMAAQQGGKITFQPGSAEIDPAANPVLEAITAELIACSGLALEIAAHSDAQGSEGGNKALSQARAEAVLMSLQGRRAPVDLLRAVGYGEERPIADNGTEAGREANRRIEFTLIGSAATPAVADAAVSVAVDAAIETIVPAQPDPGPAADTSVGADADADTSPSVAPADLDVSPRPRPANP